MMDKCRKLILGLFFLSGACGLVYEVLWVRMLGLVFGNTTYAVSTVLAAFMGGLALGSWFFGKLSDRVTERHSDRGTVSPCHQVTRSPLRLFAFLMLGIGIYCAFTPLLFRGIEQIYILLASEAEASHYILHITRFIFAFVIILIPTALMGGTLPVLTKWFAQKSEIRISKSETNPKSKIQNPKPKTDYRGNIGQNVGILYSVNTWGAVLGAFVTGYLLIMILGVRGTLYLAAAINLAIAGMVFVLSREIPLHPPLIKGEREGLKPAATTDYRSPITGNLVLLAIAVSGFTALCYEVVWTRVLSMVLGSSVYAFATMLCAFLAGIALGSLIYARISKTDYRLPITDYLASFGFLEGGIGVSVLLLIPIFGILPFVFLKLFKAFGSQFSIFSISQFLLCFGVMLIPTTLFGATIPLACKIYAGHSLSLRGAKATKQSQRDEIATLPTVARNDKKENPKSSIVNRQSSIASSVGSVYAANTLGAIIGSLMAGFALIPLIGLQRTITIVAMINVLLAIILLNFNWVAAPFKVRSGEHKIRRLKPAATTDHRLPITDYRVVRALVTCALVFFSIPYAVAVPQWNKKIIASGVYQYAPDFEKDTEQIAGTDLEKWRKWVDEEILYYKEGTHFTVAIKKSSRGKLSLSIDGKTDASNDYRKDMITQVLSGHLPLLLHPSPENVMVLGLASGATLGAVTLHQEIENIDCVEIEPAMIEASHYFDEYNYKPLEDNRVNLIINDARNYLLTTKKQYDIIISEPSNPWMSGQSNLFTKDYFQLVKNRLSDKGVFVQWLQYYNMSTQNYKMVLRTFQSVFSHTSLWFTTPGDTLLVATPERLSIDYDRLKHTLADSKINADLNRINLIEPLTLLAKFVMGEEAIKSFTADAPLHTDNQPRLEFSAPKSLYKMEIGSKNYRILCQNMETISPYLKNFKENIELAKTYLDNSFYVAGEKEISLIESLIPSPLYYRLLSQIYLEKKDFEKAITYVQKALEMNHEYTEGYNQLGKIYLAQKKYTEALKEFEKAKKLNPSFLEPYINQAIVYLDYVNVPPAALLILNDARKACSTSAEVYYQLGRTFFKMSRPKQAADMFSKAISYNPDYEKIVRETLVKLQKENG